MIGNFEPKKHKKFLELELEVSYCKVFKIRFFKNHGMNHKKLSTKNKVILTRISL